MKQANTFKSDMLDLDSPEAIGDVVWHARTPTECRAEDGDVCVTVPFIALNPGATGEGDSASELRHYNLRLRAYGSAILRAVLTFEDRVCDDKGPILDIHESLTISALLPQKTSKGWDVIDIDGVCRARIDTSLPPVRPWKDDLAPQDTETLNIEFYPDGSTPVRLMGWDRFFAGQIESFPFALVEREGKPHRALFAFHAQPSEKFVGTGERFCKLDLSGHTLVLENADALGVNNRRAYKNIPFYISSRPYGLFINTSHHVRLSVADISTRAIQGLVEEPTLDLFIIGGRTVEQLVYNYRRLTGFPHELPLWSYGTWMSRMTYFSEAEVRTVAEKLRKGKFPCDVIHLDTGWFEKDWVCEWRFSKERFPNPSKFMRDMKQNGFRVSLWQTPNIGKGNCLLEQARENGYLAPVRQSSDEPRSDFSNQEFSGQIDFSNPAALKWYQGLLKDLLDQGAAAIKTDFGETITSNAHYATMSAEELHNLYALLYQKAAFEITKQTTGEGIIWARAGWAGCHRYPVHWGGDSACTWDGMAGSLRGGLHLGLSGFAFWSHDVPGFHGVPDAMSSWPSPELYVRWTQFGVFSSHLRYHGSTPREPYEYPSVADTVRKWLRLRYALIPYIVEESKKSCRSGFPVLRALIFHHHDDPTCWHIDDQYYFGNTFLVAPVMNETGMRHIYLPEGSWVDLWTGEKLSGPMWLKDIAIPQDRMPVYAKCNDRIPIYPDRVQCTDQMDMQKCVELAFDEKYRGLGSSVLGKTSGLE